MILTSGFVNCKELFSIQNAVNHPSAAAIRGVVSVRCSDLHDRCSCNQTWEADELRKGKHKKVNIGLKEWEGFSNEDSN